jgi:hypothetical protein
MSLDLFDAAVDLDWTRDPFDRLIVAHARLRGWRLATGDRVMLAELHANSVIGLEIGPTGNDLVRSCQLSETAAESCAKKYPRTGFATLLSSQWKCHT